MSVHADRLAQLVSRVEEARKKTEADAAAWPDITLRVRTERVLAYAQIVIENSDAALVSLQMTNQLEGVLHQFIGNEPATVAANADSWGDSVLDVLASWPASRGRPVEQAVKNSVANVRRSASAHMRELSKEKDSLAGELAALQGELESMERELATSIAEQRDAIAAEIAAARQPFEQEIEQARQQLASEQASLSKLRTAQTNEYEEAEERRANATKEQRDTAEAKLADLLAQADRSVNGSVAEIERMQEDVRKMVDAVSMAATTEGYGKEAKEQRTTANVWRYVTVGASILAAGFAFLAVNRDQIDVEVLAGKLVLSLILAGIAAYAAKQSSYHRNREQIARDLQLELAIFGPFIERLDAAQQQEERVQMARKTFGHVRPVSQTTDDTPGLPSSENTDDLASGPGLISIAGREAVAALRRVQQ